jgi:1-acyl-sn-glycerol-3-phosphate acyltransferase
MGKKLAYFIIHLIVHLVAKLKVVGRENVPATGSCIVASNHLGRLDAVLPYEISQRRDLIMLVAEKYRENAFFRWMVKQLNGIYIERFNADFTALRATLRRLKQGEMLVLAPEGTRSQTEALIEARLGTGYLAAKAHVPIIPVAVYGSEDRLVKSRLRRLQRAQITVRAGKPFTLPPIHGRERDETLQQYTDEIMCQIAALLPDQYRGVYANHPRLREILQNQPIQA